MYRAWRALLAGSGLGNVVGPVASNEKGRPERRPFHRKPAAFAAASRCPQARISVRTGNLVTAVEDRGWWLDTGSPPFSCCDDEFQFTELMLPRQAACSRSSGWRRSASAVNCAK